MSNYYDKDGNPITLIQWMTILKDDESIRVNLTKFDDEFNTQVSTIWLGLNHRFGEGKPLIFETMVFSENEALSGEMKRYSTLKEAKAGHKKMCEFVKKVLSVNEQ